jgi:hypothetical protein
MNGASGPGGKYPRHPVAKPPDRRNKQQVQRLLASVRYDNGEPRPPMTLELGPGRHSFLIGGDNGDASAPRLLPGDRIACVTAGGSPTGGGIVPTRGHVTGSAGVRIAAVRVGARPRRLSDAPADARSERLHVLRLADPEGRDARAVLQLRPARPPSDHQPASCAIAYHPIRIRTMNTAIAIAATTSGQRGFDG